MAEEGPGYAIVCGRNRIVAPANCLLNGGVERQNLLNLMSPSRSEMRDAPAFSSVTFN